MKTIGKLLSVAAACSVMITGTAQATIVASESFESYSPGPLAGGSGGTGWTSVWAVPTTVPVTVVSASLSYTSGQISVQGGSRAAEIGGPAALGGVDDIFDRRFPTQGGTLYMSFL